ncbi:unnamed protein product, partial [marine sediment metagenome]
LNNLANKKIEMTTVYPKKLPNQKTKKFIKNQIDDAETDDRV